MTSVSPFRWPSHESLLSFAFTDECGGRTWDMRKAHFGKERSMSGSSGEADPMKLFRDMKLPALPDMEAVLSTYRRNMEVLSQANRIALEGAQTIGKRHMEILQQTMSELR